MGDFLFALVFEIVGKLLCAATGHCLLWLMSFGRWKASEGNNDAALVVGVVFWCLVVAGVVWWIV
jgi:hypothetical protein